MDDCLDIELDSCRDRIVISVIKLKLASKKYADNHFLEFYQFAIEPKNAII